LLERLILEIESVFEQTLLQELADVVKGNVNEYGSKYRGCHIEPEVESYRIESCVHTGLEQPDGKERHDKSTDQWVEYLTTCIKLDVLLVSSTYASDADAKYGSKLAPYKIAVVIDKPPLHAVMDITDDTSPIVKQLWVYGILKELNYE
jgi:hypothetical protein